jgi:hypothetical protein
MSFFSKFLPNTPTSIQQVSRVALKRYESRSYALKEQTELSDACGKASLTYEFEDGTKTAVLGNSVVTITLSDARSRAKTKNPDGSTSNQIPVDTALALILNDQASAFSFATGGHILPPRKQLEEFLWSARLFFVSIRQIYEVEKEKKRKERENKKDQGIEQNDGQESESITQDLRVRTAKYLRKILDMGGSMDANEEEEAYHSLMVALDSETEEDRALDDMVFLASILNYPEDWSQKVYQEQIKEFVDTSRRFRSDDRSEEARIYLCGWKMLNSERDVLIA